MLINCCIKTVYQEDWLQNDVVKKENRGIKLGTYVSAF